MNTQAAVEEIDGGAKQATGSVADELKKIGKLAFSQILGIHPSEPTLTDEEIEEKDKKDKELSEIEQAQLRAKIQAIYDEYARLKKRQQQLEEQQEKQEEEVKELEEERRHMSDNTAVRTAIGKGSAETGRNFGAE